MSRLVDTVHNGQGTGADALYVDNLTVPSGTTLDLHGLNAYARVANIQGTIVNGTITPLGSGGPLTQNVSASGTLVAGATDAWSYYGRAGDVVTLVVNTGNAGSAAPVPPTLNFATVTLETSSNTVVASQTNSQSGADVILSGVTLSASGTYQVLVQAGQAGATGDYNVTVYDATPQTAAVNLNEATTGTVTPYQTDEWTFTGTAGQVVQFNLVNSANPATEFDLTGPNGFTGFTNATASSGAITLPSNGTYQVTVHNTQKEAGTYAFALDNTNITNLTLGTPVSESIQGTGQSQLFQLIVTQPGQVNLTLTDNASRGCQRALCQPGLGADAEQFHPWIYTGSSANKQLSIPTAAPGTYYILVYTYSAPAAGSFTLEATEASVFLNAVSPSEGGTAAAATLTLTGAGFDNTSAVSLVSSGGTAFAANTTSVNSPTQITATFTAGSVPAGAYAVKVILSSGASSTLTNTFTMIQGGQANLVTNLIVPSGMGNHAPATLYLQYSNTGDLAMPAPLLVVTGVRDGRQGAILTLDQSRADVGFWTADLPVGYSNTILVLASGKTPGLLQPGESEQVPIYYDGWQQPWDTNPFQFSVATIKADDTTAINWSSLQAELQPPSFTTAGWSAVYGNFVSEVGNTGGSLVTALDAAASYLGSLGENVTAVDTLVNFEFWRGQLAQSVVDVGDGAADSIRRAGLAPDLHSRLPRVDRVSL